MLTVQPKNNQVEIAIWVKPNAKKTGCLGIKNGRIEITLQAKPEDGQANNALLAYLADFCHVRKNQVFLKRGFKSRQKVVVLPWTAGVESWLKSLG